MAEGIKLNKDVYSRKQALDKLDEEFNFFGVSQINLKQWFDLYNRLFYEIKKETHQYFLNNSIPHAYPEGYESLLTKEFHSLKAQLRTIRRQIDSFVREHFYFKNGIFLMDLEHTNNPTAKLQEGTGQVYFMQSGKKRQITNYQIYLNLKNKITKRGDEIDDSTFIVFVSAQALSGIGSAPPINTIEDTQLSPLEINIYPRTLEEYEDLANEGQFLNELLNAPQDIESNSPGGRYN